MCRISSSFARIAPKIFIRFVPVCPPRCAVPSFLQTHSRRAVHVFYAYITNIIYKSVNPPHMPHGAALRPIRHKSAFLCARTVYSDTHASFGCACLVQARMLRSGAHAANCRTEFAAVRRISRIRYTRLMPPKADVQIAASKTQPTLCPHRKIMQAGHAPAFKQNSGPAARELKPVGKSSRTKLKPLRKQSLNFTVKITQTEKSLRDKKSLRINQMLWRVSVKRT